MLTRQGQRVPTRVAGRFGPSEASVASLHGLGGSGFALTERRLFAWRESGSVGPVPLAGIERILIDEGSGSDHLLVVVQPRLAMHPPLVLTRRASDLVGTLGFVADVAAALGVEPDAERFGPVHRFSFPVVAGETSHDRSSVVVAA
jgi:hypothetical protein